MERRDLDSENQQEVQDQNTEACTRRVWLLQIDDEHVAEHEAGFVDGQFDRLAFIPGLFSTAEIRQHACETEILEL